ncbi:hypothetical protein CR513_20664, partial [Mucuna pruriens]
MSIHQLCVNKRARLEKPWKQLLSEHFRVTLLDSLVSWSDALTQVANFAGWDMRNYEDEVEQLKKIVNGILAELGNTLLSITEFLVGLDSRSKNNLLQLKYTRLLATPANVR